MEPKQYVSAATLSRTIYIYHIAMHRWTVDDYVRGDDDDLSLRYAFLHPADLRNSLLSVSMVDGGVSSRRTDSLFITAKDTICHHRFMNLPEVWSRARLAWIMGISEKCNCADG